MADRPDELDPTQATEARLCAYLEGTLSPGDRTEIEKYLAQSPTHRKLLHDLATTRSWVSELPKMSAPHEIAEMFEAVSERNMLLDDSASAASVRINRGPQVMLTAAIVLLALGLGTIIYLVLTIHGPTAQKYVSSMKTAPAPTTKPEPAGSIMPTATPAPAPAIVDGGGRSGLLPSIAKPGSPTSMPTKIALAKVPATMQVAAAAPTQSLGAQMQMANTPVVLPSTTSTMALARNSNTNTDLAMNENAAAGVIHHAMSTTVASTQPGKVAVGDRLLVDIPQLVGPGVEKTTTVRVDPDGKITLPMLDAMAAAGRTTVDLQKQIGDRYRDEHLITNPVVVVTIATTPKAAASQPTTKPASQPTTKPVH